MRHKTDQRVISLSVVMNSAPADGRTVEQCHQRSFFSKRLANDSVFSIKLDKKLFWVPWGVPDRSMYSVMALHSIFR